MECHENLVMPTKPCLSLPSLPETGLALACALLLSGCNDSKKEASNGPSQYPYRVTTTVGMITDIVREVAGDKATVEGIIGEGIDPHLYKANSSDVKALQSAEVIFYNGLMLEGKMADVLVRVARSGKPVLAVTETILEQEDYVISDEEDHYDPHVWMDVRGWMKAVEVVAASLAGFDPANADHYQANATAYLAQLENLDDYARQCFATIPEDQRMLITAHDAFGYLARAYGLEVRGIQGLSTESEAGVRDIEQLIDLLVERKIPAVFVETSVSDKNVKALVEGTRALGHEVRISGKLFSDAMGPTGSYEGTYLGMLDHNITTITRALGGEAPQQGLQGKLGR